MRYQVIFDITQTPFSHWSPLVFALFAATVCIGFHLRSYRRGKRSGSRIFWECIGVTAFLTIVPMLLFVFTWRDYLSLRSALRDSQCKIVEGAVANLRRGGFWGEGGEKGFGEIFVVDGVEFRCRSEGGMQNGFRQAGVIRQGMKVRIHYCDRGDFSKDIARLEIAP